jgi:metallophosphoesterase (TIGR00282 family)
MRLLFIGDIVGKSGVDIVCQAVPGLRRRESLNLVVVNAENAEGGSGITPAIYRRLKEAQIDCITLGDHIYRKKDIIKILNRENDIVKPANFPPEAPGKGWTLVKTSFGRDVAVVSLMGRVFMRPVDCPYHAADKVLAEIPPEVKIRFVDFHAEATSDKQLMGRFLDGRVSAVLGTHTHVTTADERILPGGTAFQCDVGMTGPHESILGRDIESVMETTVTFYPKSFHVAKQDVRISGTIVDLDRETGLAKSIRRISIDEKEAEQLQNTI